MSAGTGKSFISISLSVCDMYFAVIGEENSS